MRKVVFTVCAAALSACLATAALADDQQIANAIALNLKTSGQMKGYKLDIKCQQGNAILTGTVASEQQRATALALAQQTEGVTNVVDRIVVGARPTMLTSNRSTGAATGNGAPPRGFAPASNIPVTGAGAVQSGPASPIPAVVPGMAAAGVTPARYDQPYLPNHAWPAYAAYPNYGAVTYPKQYSATAWPYIGPFYPYPQVPLGWRKVTLEWDDGWWMLDFKARRH